MDNQRPSKAPQPCLAATEGSTSLLYTGTGKQNGSRGSEDSFRELSKEFIRIDHTERYHSCVAGNTNKEDINKTDVVTTRAFPCGSAAIALQRFDPIKCIM